MIKTSSVIFLVVIGLFVFPNSTEYIQPPMIEEKPESEIILYFTGDIMLDRGVDFYIRKNEDWHWPFLRISDFLNQADLVFGNLESMISDKGVNVGSIYSFRANPNTIDSLRFAGFDILSIANNHSFDYTRIAFEDTMNRLKNADIDYIGGGFSENEAYTPVIKDIGGAVLAFLGYSNIGSSLWKAQEETPGIAWIDIESLDKFKQDIQSAKEQADILIISIHFGEEYQETPNAQQRKLAESAIDFGADLVVGHHPHVLQPLEKYKQGWIAYSLGNFVFDQYFSENTMKSAILKITIEDKKIKDVKLIPVALTEEYQVYLSD